MRVHECKQKNTSKQQKVTNAWCGVLVELEDAIVKIITKDCASTLALCVKSSWQYFHLSQDILHASTQTIQWPIKLLEDFCRKKILHGFVHQELVTRMLPSPCLRFAVSNRLLYKASASRLIRRRSTTRQALIERTLWQSKIRVVLMNFVMVLHLLLHKAPARAAEVNLHPGHFAEPYFPKTDTMSSSMAWRKKLNNKGTIWEDESSETWANIAWLYRNGEIVEMSENIIESYIEAGNTMELYWTCGSCGSLQISYYQQCNDWNCRGEVYQDTGHRLAGLGNVLLATRWLQT
jgi:hypothetical protein